MRRSPLEPEPQGGAATVGYVAAPVPLLVVASLTGGDEVDATTVSEDGGGGGDRKGGREDARALRVALFPLPSSHGKRKKRKRKRKRKTPQNLFFGLGWCAATAMWARITSLFVVWCPYVYCVLGSTRWLRIRDVEHGSAFAPHDMAAIMVGMDEKDSDMCYAGFAGYDEPRVMVPSVVDARHHGRYEPEGQHSSCARHRFQQWHVQGWFFLVLRLAVCSLLYRQAQMLGILAGMFQKNTYAVGWFYWLRCSSRCFLRCRQAQDARHHGRYEAQDYCVVCIWQGRRHHCRGAEAVSFGPVQQTTEIHQLQSIDKVFYVPVVHVQQVPRVQAVRRQPRSHSCSSLQRGHCC